MGPPSGLPRRRFSPSAADEQAVLDWAKSQGLTVTQRFPNRMLVNLEAPVARLEKAFQDHSSLLVDLRIEFPLASLRDDPRFRDLLRRMGMPE